MKQLPGVPPIAALTDCPRASCRPVGPPNTIHFHTLSWSGVRRDLVRAERLDRKQKRPPSRGGLSDVGIAKESWCVKDYAFLARLRREAPIPQIPKTDQMASVAGSGTTLGPGVGPGVETTKTPPSLLEPGRSPVPNEVKRTPND